MGLRWIGRANIIVGLVSFVRLFTEILFFWSSEDRSNLQAFALFDAGVAVLWSLSGMYLLSRHEFALSMTAMAAGAAAARTIISGMLLGPFLARKLWEIRDDPEFLGFLAPALSRFLHYGIEFIYWPVVLFLILKVSDNARRQRHPDLEFSTGASFAVTGMIAAVVQVALIKPLV